MLETTVRSIREDAFTPVIIPREYAPGIFTEPGLNFNPVAYIRHGENQPCSEVYTFGTRLTIVVGDPAHYEGIPVIPEEVLKHLIKHDWEGLRFKAPWEIEASQRWLENSITGYLYPEEEE